MLLKYGSLKQTEKAPCILNVSVRILTDCVLGSCRHDVQDSDLNMLATGRDAVNSWSVVPCFVCGIVSSIVTER